jgi:hypothetical protein
MNKRSTCLALSLAICSALASAAPPANSSYATDPQSSHVEDATSEGVGQVNSITCILAALRPEALVNQGNYNALVDEAKCDSEGRSSAANSGNGNGAPAVSYLTTVVNSTRTSNNDPMIAKIWIDQEENGQHKSIDVHVAATQPPTTANPYGVFRMDFCGRGDNASNCQFNGYLQGADDGIRFFQTETRDDGQGLDTQTVGLRLNASGTTSGSGRLQFTGNDGQAAYDFAYNANLFRRSDGNEDQCFTRDASDPATGISVYRYGLYDATTGARVTRNSGFPIEFSTAATTYRGYLGYHGLQLPAPALAELTNGSTVRKVDYVAGQAPVISDFNVVKAGGKMTKHTRRTRTLQSIDKIKFSTFVRGDAADFFSGAMSDSQYELFWDDTDGAFKATALMMCSQNGCQTQPLQQVQSISLSYFQAQGGVQGWSQSLGGELFVNLQDVSTPIDSSVVSVAYRTQDLVYPSQLPASLFCVRDCPTSATLSGYFSADSAASPYVTTSFNNFMPTPAVNVVQYHTDVSTALLLDAADQAVTFTDAEAFQMHPQYQFGVRSGRLFPTLADAECAGNPGSYCESRVNALDVYYQWETGPGSFNQFAAVKGSNGQFVRFDAPLQVTFDVPSGAAYGQYANQSLVLQYSGFGELFGLPGFCVSRLSNEHVSCEEESARYVAAFSIPFDQTLGRVTSGSDTYLVKWLEREIRFARKDASVCGAAGLNLPAGVMLPMAADLKNPADPNSDIHIGAKPTVDAAPRVIHGDVKF